LEAETKRNRFFTLAVDMLAIAEFDGTFKQLNPSWEKTLGFSDDELRSRPFIEFIHPDDQPGTLEHLERLRTGAPSTYFEHRFACKGGGYRWLGWTAAPFLSEGLLYVFSRDLTDRKVAEEERVKRIREQTARAAAEASERRSAFLAEATGSLSGSLDEEEILGGLTALAVPGLADWCFVDSVDEQNEHRRVQVTHADPGAFAVAERIARLSLTDSSGSAQARVMRDGRSVIVRTVGESGTDAFIEDPDHLALVEALGARSMLVVPLRCRDRSLAALTFVSTDPHHRYDREDLELADELARRAALAVDNAHLYKTSQEARKAAETANRAKDEFLATLSHELRTPLTPILGWTVMLRSGTLDQASMIRGLEVIERNVRAQTQLIGDLLDVSRIITGKLRLEVRPVDIGPVIEAGVEAVRSSAEAKDITLELDLHLDVPQVNADPDRLQQVVWNLVSNAVKFTAAGGRVQVRLRRAEGRIQIAVSDTGKGISASFLPFVFDRFRQADSTSTRTHGGLGLGLAIVRHLVELHGGTVSAESPGEGRGSTFTVELPLVADPAGAPLEPRTSLGAAGRD
ncbi:MAG: ATP-binding protein, partial [bacterium]